MATETVRGSVLAAVILLAGGVFAEVLSPDRARPYGRGFVRDGDELVVDNGADAARDGGACWTLKLNQAEPAPFSVRTAARCEKGPGGGRVRDFSLYLDVTYADGDHLWGQTADFAPNPDLGWRTGVVTVLPPKPVRSAQVYCLYRGLPGRVRFRPPEVRMLPADSILFDSLPVSQGELPTGTRGFLVRDVNEPDGRFAPIAVDGTAMGLRLSARETAGAVGDARVEVTVEDLTGKDRAVTLVYAVPLPSGDLVFERDPRTSVALGPKDPQVSDARPAGCGAGGLNRWPFGAVTVGGRGQALGIDTAHPAFFRTAVHPQTRLLFIAFDLGFAPEKRAARFAFRRFSFAGGFRGALAKYASLEPAAFKVRLPRHGVWMPFHRTSTVEGWEDFGFMFKEGDNETAWDDAHGLVTFRYTEPTTWWMSMDKVHGTNAFTRADCLARAEARAAGGEPLAVAWRESGMVDGDGLRVGQVKDAPWCRGAIWLLSPLPGIAGACEYKVKHDAAAYAKRYAAVPPAGVDGEYVDSAEGYLTPPVDYNRKVFAASETPLVFSSDECARPGVFKGLAMYEYVRATAGRVWGCGRHMMANGVPGSWPWLPAYVDVGGTETAWIDGKGAWRPESHESLIYKRAMSMGKPYCYLQNVDFAKFASADMERFMRHCVAYGFFPGCFSHNASEGHYFSRPDIYNRGRPLFKKYVPICRTLSEAGWRPVNALVSVSEPAVYAEQFGVRYATVFNAAKTALKVRLTTRPQARANDLVTGRSITFDASGAAEVTLSPDEVLALSFD